MGSRFIPSGSRLVSAMTYVVAFLVVAPLVVILSSWSSRENQVFAHLADTVLYDLFLNTLILLVGVGTGVLLLGVSLAWLVVMYDFPGRRIFEWALMLPLAIPTYVLAFVFLAFMNFGGPVQTALRALLGPKGYWFPDMRSAGAVVAVMTLVLYPYVYMLARGAFLSQGRGVVEAARILGKGPAGAFFFAALPMARPAIAAGVALALMETLADFGAVAIFNFDTFTTAIYKAWFGLFNLNAAAQLASLLLLFVATALFMERRMRGAARYYRSGGNRKRLPRLSGVRGGLAAAFCGLVLTLSFLLPCGQLLYWVVDQALGDLDSRYLGMLWHTLMLGGIAGLITTAGALMLGLARRGGQASWSIRVAVRVATLGYALPGSVLAVGIMLFLVWVDKSLLMPLVTWAGGEGGLILTGGLSALFFAYLTRFLAVAYGPVENAILRIRPSVLEVARSLGAGPGRILWEVELPLLRPGLLTALLLVLVEVMKEMPATLLLRPFGWDTLAVRIFEMTSEGEWTRAALPALTLVLVGLPPVILLVRKTSDS